MPRTGASIPIDGGAGFAIEFHPANAGAEHRSTVRLYMATRSKSRLTGAGLSAVMGVINTYLSSSKAAAVQVRAGATSSPKVEVTPEGCIVDLLPEDAVTIAASLTAVVNVAANVAA